MSGPRTVGVTPYVVLEQKRLETSDVGDIFDAHLYFGNSFRRQTSCNSRFKIIIIIENRATIPNRQYFLNTALLGCQQTLTDCVMPSVSKSRIQYVTHAELLFNSEAPLARAKFGKIRMETPQVRAGMSGL